MHGASTRRCFLRLLAQAGGDRAEAARQAGSSRALCGRGAGHAAPAGHECLSHRAVGAVSRTVLARASAPSLPAVVVERRSLRVYAALSADGA